MIVSPPAAELLLRLSPALAPAAAAALPRADATTVPTPALLASALRYRVDTCGRRLSPPPQMPQSGDRRPGRAAFWGATTRSSGANWLVFTLRTIGVPLGYLQAMAIMTHFSLCGTSLCSGFGSRRCELWLLKPSLSGVMVLEAPAYALHLSPLPLMLLSLMATTEMAATPVRHTARDRSATVCTGAPPPQPAGPSRGLGTLRGGARGRRCSSMRLRKGSLL